MPNHSTRTLGDADLERLAELIMENPKFLTLLDEKFGAHLGDMKADIDELKQGQKTLGEKIDRIQEGINNLASHLQTFLEGQQTTARTLAREIEQRLLRALKDRT